MGENRKARAMLKDRRGNTSIKGIGLKKFLILQLRKLRYRDGDY